MVRPETIAVVKESVEALILMLSPFTPHGGGGALERLGHAGGVVAAAGPPSTKPWRAPKRSWCRCR